MEKLAICAPLDTEQSGLKSRCTALEILVSSYISIISLFKKFSEHRNYRQVLASLSFVSLRRKQAWSLYLCRPSFRFRAHALRQSSPSIQYVSLCISSAECASPGLYFLVLLQQSFPMDRIIKHAPATPKPRDGFCL